MRNVFLLFIPPANPQAMVHYEDTIKQRVPMARIAPFVSAGLRDRLLRLFGPNPITVWGSEAGERNRANFERMSAGDDVLIVEGESIKLLGKVGAKVESRELSRELWKPLTGKGDTTWQLIYFIANARELDLPFTEFCALFGYRSTYRLRGFTAVSEERLEDFYSRYDDLYSVLEQLQRGEAIAEKPPEAIAAPELNLVEVTADEISAVLQSPAFPEHLQMQFTIARLGIKAGERVWVPVGDQTRLRQAFGFDSFDPQFAAGIDLPHSYLENIDVVWKQEFRIGAAYEIENSTSIYSGLLRFADLNILAPNTLYPMFVVAPRERKNRLREQLRRPAFRKLELDRKVRFLSYEIVSEIDTFFSDSNAGLTVDLIVARSESVLDEP